MMATRNVKLHIAKPMHLKCISNRFPPTHLIASPLSGDFHKGSLRFTYTRFFCSFIRWEPLRILSWAQGACPLLVGQTSNVTGHWEPQTWATPAAPARSQRTCWTWVCKGLQRRPGRSHASRSDRRRHGLLWAQQALGPGGLQRQQQDVAGRTLARGESAFAETAAVKC